MINARRAMLAMPLLLAACSTAAPQPTGGGPTPPAISTSGPATSATASPGPSATTGATEAPTSSPSPVPSPAVTVTPDASLSGDLVSLMPTEIAGNQMTIEPASDSAGSFMILWNDEVVAQTLLTVLGATPDDIDVVFSYPTGNTGSNRVSVDAYRVAGADAIALRDGMVANYRAYLGSQIDVSVTEETVSDKPVVRLAQADAPPGEGNYFYAVGDIVFVVSGTPFAWVEDAIAQLP